MRWWCGRTTTPSGAVPGTCSTGGWAARRRWWRSPTSMSEWGSRGAGWEGGWVRVGCNMVGRMVWGGRGEGGERGYFCASRGRRGRVWLRDGACGTKHLGATDPYHFSLPRACRARACTQIAYRATWPALRPFVPWRQGHQQRQAHGQLGRHCHSCLHCGHPRSKPGCRGIINVKKVGSWGVIAYTVVFSCIVAAGILKDR